MPASDAPTAADGRTTLRYGLVTGPSDQTLQSNVDLLLGWMGAQVAGLTLQRRDATSYEELATAVTKGDVDVAWLPPIVYVRLADAATALGSIVRAGRADYEAALIVRRDSKIRGVESLRGTRAGWVDRWSAAGFVLPRVKLALMGLDPRRCFRTESFYGSHAAVVQALLDGSCDVAGTYAHGKSAANGGSWSELASAEVRVLETFGAIPPDVLATRSGLDPAGRAMIEGALRRAIDDPRGRVLLKQVFGGDELSETSMKSYESLVSALKLASARGLFD